MSGYTDDVISRHGGLSGDMVYLEKPFAPDTLIGKVQEALRQRAPVPPKAVVREN
jgi:DNA-binding response OmpR family regulator